MVRPNTVTGVAISRTWTKPWLELGHVAVIVHAPFANHGGLFVRELESGDLGGSGKADDRLGVRIGGEHCAPRKGGKAALALGHFDRIADGGRVDAAKLRQEVGVDHDGSSQRLSAVLVSLGLSRVRI